MDSINIILLKSTLTQNQLLILKSELAKQKPSKNLTIILWFFLGIFGVHRFYNKDYYKGTLMLFTLGGLFIWWLIDLFNINKIVNKRISSLEKELILSILHKKNINQPSSPENNDKTLINDISFYKNLNLTIKKHPFITILLTILFAVISISIQDASPKPIKSNTKTTTNTKLDIPESIITEVASALNDLESSNDNYDIYSGLNYSEANAYNLQIKVNDHWNYISKDRKLEFIKHIGSTWTGMFGARNISFDPSLLEISIIHDKSGRELATWDYIFGPSIK